MAELDLLDAELLAQLAGVALGERRSLDDEPAQRLAQLQLRGGRAWWPSPTTRRTSATSLQQRRVGRPRLGPAGEVHRAGASPAAVAHEALPEMLGEERHHRRDRRASPARARARAPAARSRRRPRSDGASVGCTSWRRRRRTPRTRGSRSTVRNALVRRRSPRPRAGRVRATSQRSSGQLRPGRRERRSRAGSPRSSRSRRGTGPSSRACSSFRLISCAGPKPKSRFRSGGCAQNCQRITSAPIRANASGASIVFPHELCISRPSRRASSRSRAPAGTAPCPSARPT